MIRADDTKAAERTERAYFSLLSAGEGQPLQPGGMVGMASDVRNPRGSVDASDWRLWRQTLPR